jgi:ATP-binding cassette subfamily B protein
MNAWGEVQNMKEEKEELGMALIDQIPLGDVTFNHLSFKYSSHDKSPVLDNLSLTIPYQKTTAIVGASGSGKTTLLKLLLKFFSTYDKYHWQSMI